MDGVVLGGQIIPLQANKVDGLELKVNGGELKVDMGEFKVDGGNTLMDGGGGWLWDLRPKGRGKKMFIL